jgi:prepilin-type N-terminal cleavage/methylation domain-containing protein
MMTGSIENLIRSSRRQRATRSRGFTLAELVVALAVFTIILTGIMALFVFNTRLARAQMHVTGMQQSLRVAQYELVRSVRMAGRGGLPTSLYARPPGFAGQLLPSGLAISVANNVPSGTQIAACNCAEVLEGTDILTVRGVFNSPIYQLNPAAADFQYDATTGTGTVIVRKTSPTGVPQDLTAFEDRISDGIADSVLLVSPLDDSVYAIVEMQPGGSSVTQVGGVTEFVTIAFRTQGGNTAEYLALSPAGGYPVELTTVSYVGLLEELQFYVREVRAIPGDATSELIPRLSRAQVFPGTTVAYENDTDNLTGDLTENIIDLQVAIGIDTVPGIGPADGVVTEGDGVSPAPTNDDEWLFNHTGDDPNDVKWVNTEAVPAKVFYLRINTLARTDRPDTRFQAPLLTLIEDKDFTSSPFDVYNTRDERMYRRRNLQTTVDLRNL